MSHPANDVQTLKSRQLYGRPWPVSKLGQISVKLAVVWHAVSEWQNTWLIASTTSGLPLWRSFGLPGTSDIWFGCFTIRAALLSNSLSTAFVHRPVRNCAGHPSVHPSSCLTYLSLTLPGGSAGAFVQATLSKARDHKLDQTPVHQRTHIIHSHTHT